MEALELIERIPAVAQAMQRSAQLSPDSPPADWKVHAREPGHAGQRTVRVETFGQSRALAVELSDIGFMVVVCDPKDCQRLQLWPPRHDDP